MYLALLRPDILNRAVLANRVVVKTARSATMSVKFRYELALIVDCAFLNCMLGPGQLEQICS